VQQKRWDAYVCESGRMQVLEPEPLQIASLRGAYSILSNTGRNRLGTWCPCTWTVDGRISRRQVVRQSLRVGRRPESPAGHLPSCTHRTHAHQKPCELGLSSTIQGMKAGAEVTWRCCSWREIWQTGCGGGRSSSMGGRSRHVRHSCPAGLFRHGGECARYARRRLQRRWNGRMEQAGKGVSNRG
jgi:hypothetical protein